MQKLRDYQLKAIEDLRFHFARGKKRILLVSPTGSGKTVIACSMIKNTKGLSNNEIAQLEIKHNVIPIKIKRYLPNGDHEIWTVSEWNAWRSEQPSRRAGPLPLSTGTRGYLFACAWH